MSEEKNIPPEKNSEDQGQSFDPILPGGRQVVIGSAQGKPEPISETSLHKFPEDKQAPAIKEQKEINDEPETDNMEVHHHGHVHEKKKWKEYLFQFFMLFLAVFCGFLAEYQLEHVIENKREKQFMQSMVNDLVLDTALLN